MRRAALALAGAAVLVAAAALRLPRTFQILRPESNPFRRTLSPFDGAAFALLQPASEAIPPGSRVAVEAASGRAADSAYCALLAAGMLPGREVRPGGPSGAGGWNPDFLIVFGSRRPGIPAHAMLRRPEGTVWKANR